jgi:lipid A 3-O-deacylase
MRADVWRLLWSTDLPRDGAESGEDGLPTMTTQVALLRLGYGLLGSVALVLPSFGEALDEPARLDSAEPAPTAVPVARGEEPGGRSRDFYGEKPREWAVSVRWENDTFGGTDRFYTDGVSISVIHSGGGWLDGFADWLPWGEGHRSVGYDLGQIIVTSSDKLLAFPDPMDRPYAGALLAGLTLHVDRGRCYHGLKLIAGVVGPWSFAEEIQTEVHRFAGVELPRGWDYQLGNEPVVDLIYEHRRRYRFWGDGPGFAWEALPKATAMIGNLVTQGQVGGQLRWGYHLPDDFGVTLLRGMGHLPPPRRSGTTTGGSSWGAYGYGGVHANLVLHNITLDGNTWQDSRSVDKELFVPAAEVGVAVITRHFVTAFSYVFLGHEFEGQKHHSEFGAFTVTYLF